MHQQFEGKNMHDGMADHGFQTSLLQGSPGPKLIKLFLRNEHYATI